MCENHSHSHHCSRKERKNKLIRIVVSSIVFILTILLPCNSEVKFILFLSAYLIAGFDILPDAFFHLLKGKMFDENFLMCIATIGAFCLKEYPEAVSVILLFQIGEYFQDKAVNKTRDSITRLINIKPEYANIERNGILVPVKPEDIKINDIITVKAGERIPLDGVIVEGQSSIDTSSLTGESVLKDAGCSDFVLSGSINITGVLKMKVSKLYKDSTVSKIFELVEHATSKKSKTERFITRFAKYYTPLVVLLALMIVMVPFLLNGIENINIRIERALTFLVISCPCALVISIPLSFFAGIGAASKSGILIKGSNYLEMLANPDTIVFDKTGTLTNGNFQVTSVKPAAGICEDELLKYAAYAENYSNHPVALAIKEAYNLAVNSAKIECIKEESGKGIKALIENSIILAGNKKLMQEYNIELPKLNETGNVVYIAKNNKFSGYVVVSDTLKHNAGNLIQNLKEMGIKTAILSGDSVTNTSKTALELNIDNYYAELLPDNKVEKIEEIIKNKQRNRSVIFTGDGINDAPVLMRSDAGIAMGALGSDAAIEAADIVIADDNLEKIQEAINIAKKTMLIVKENIIFAIGVKILFLLLGGIGFMSMWGAVFADVGVTLIAVLNSIRIFKTN